MGQSAQSEAAASDRVIEARGLERRFGDFVAVAGIDITVSRGEVFGLLGANGAGKTTAIRMLCGTLRPSAGAIRVAGIDIVRRAQRARSRIGYLAQRFALYGDLKVLENLRLQAGLYGLRGPHRDQRIEWALEHLGLGDLRQRLAGELPLGYQRRLALAAALLHEPEVLFLDEPTSGVDPVARQRFWELIYDLADRGIGILVTTHYMDEALFCDRLALMNAGRIIIGGTPQALLQRPLATPLLELHMHHSSEALAAIEAIAGVREIIPHAGRLRIRLEAGADPEALMGAIRAAAQAQQRGVLSLGSAANELEDVFIALLEEAGKEARP